MLAPRIHTLSEAIDNAPPEFLQPYLRVAHIRDKQRKMGYVGKKSWFIPRFTSQRPQQTLGNMTPLSTHPVITELKPPFHPKVSQGRAQVQR